MENRKTVIVTGGCGFIGSNFVQKIASRQSETNFIIVDSLTYAGRLDNIQPFLNLDNISFVQADISNIHELEPIFDSYEIDGIINIAAESHVDTSIASPNQFIATNISGTLNLLELSKYSGRDIRFLQMSTDEVFGSLNENDPPFNTQTNLAPNNPYSASKASADLIVRSFNKTYGLDTVVVRASNNYGPYQNPEKFIPKCIFKILSGEEIELYGSGKQIRDWLHVFDCVEGIWAVYNYPKSGEIVLLGGENEWQNKEVARIVCSHMNVSEDLISYIDDRPGHDFRYALDISETISKINWRPTRKLSDELDEIIDWYKDNIEWLNSFDV